MRLRVSIFSKALFLSWLCWKQLYLANAAGRAWNQTAKLTAPDGAGERGRFGWSLSLLESTMALVGSFGDDGGSGAVYMFSLSTDVWSPAWKVVPNDLATGDYFGFDMVGLSPTSFAASAYRDGFSGSVYIFSNVDGVWSDQAKFSSLEANHDDFGRTLANLGSERLVVGAPFDDDYGLNAGAVYVYMFAASVWSQTSKVFPNDIGMLDYFGHSVAGFEDPNKFLVGARGHQLSTGAAYVFTFSGGAWSQAAKLVTPDSSAADVASFGYYVTTIGSNMALVGGRQERNMFNANDGDVSLNAGCVFVFTRSELESWTFSAHLEAAGSSSYSPFGQSFEPSSSSGVSSYIVGVSPAEVMMGGWGANNQGIYSGAALVFTLSESGWVQSSTLLASDSGPDEHFGKSMTRITSEMVIVGAPGVDSGDTAGDVTNSGAAYVFVATEADAGGVRVVVLESFDFEYTAMKFDGFISSVVISQVLGDTPATDSNWGYGGSTLWVSDGLRAEFKLVFEDFSAETAAAADTQVQEQVQEKEEAQVEDKVHVKEKVQVKEEVQVKGKVQVEESEASAGGVRVVVLESLDFEYTAMKFDRDISSVVISQVWGGTATDSNWGYDGSTLWVSDGLRAEFKLVLGELSETGVCKSDADCNDGKSCICPESLTSSRNRMLRGSASNPKKRRKHHGHSLKKKKANKIFGEVHSTHRHLYFSTYTACFCAYL